MNTPAPSGPVSADLAPSDSQIADVLARYPSSDAAAGCAPSAMGWGGAYAQASAVPVPPTDGSEHPAIHGYPVSPTVIIKLPKVGHEWNGPHEGIDHSRKVEFARVIEGRLTLSLWGRAHSRSDLLQYTAPWRRRISANVFYANITIGGVAARTELLSMKAMVSTLHGDVKEADQVLAMVQKSERLLGFAPFNAGQIQAALNFIWEHAIP